MCLLFMAITQLHAVKNLPYIVSNVMALLTCLPMAIGIMVFGKSFSGLFENKMLATTGMISYEIYLVHAVILEGLGMVRVQIGLPNAAFLILALLLTGAGAVLSKKLIEDPIAGLVARSRMWYHSRSLEN